MPGYVDSILALKKEYKDDIEIKLGFETEYYPKYFDKLLEFYSQYPIDYIIMGQHFVLNEEEHIYSGELHHEEDMMMRYVDQVIEGLETGCFTYLAHLRKTMKRQQISCVFMQQRIRCRLKLICLV